MYSEISAEMKSNGNNKQLSLESMFVKNASKQ